MNPDCETICNQNPGAIVVTDTDTDTTIVFRRPTRPIVERFLASAMDDKTSKLGASERLVDDCLLYPAPAVVRALYETRPMLPISLMEELTKAAGLKASFTRGRP